MIPPTDTEGWPVTSITRPAGLAFDETVDIDIAHAKLPPSLEPLKSSVVVEWDACEAFQGRASGACHCSHFGSIWL